jgi:hypothetical protein
MVKYGTLTASRNQPFCRTKKMSKTKAKARAKIETTEELASEISTQCVMGTANTLIQRLNVPKKIVMHAMAQGLGVMAANPNGTDDLDWLIKTIRSASKQTATHYRTHPDSGEMMIGLRRSLTMITTSLSTSSRKRFRKWERTD